MFTRCPSCRAAFSITDQQLEIAAGMVRCGMCEHVFDAKLFLFNQSLDRDLYEPPQPVNEAEEIQQVDVELTADDNGAADQSAIDLEVLDRELHDGAPSQSSHVTNIVEDTIDTSQDAAHTPQTETANDPAIPKIIADQVSNLEQEPVKFTPAQWMGAAAIVALIAMLGLQAVAAMKSNLLPEQFQSSVCQWLKCTLETPRAVSKIEVLNRSIFTHPSEPEALMVTLTMINRAQFPQPYPVIQLRFLNINGEVIAARQFTANHYLREKWLPQSLMTAAAPLSIQLEVHDVGEEVVSYDFDFL